MPYTRVKRARHASAMSKGGAVETSDDGVYKAIQPYRIGA